MADVLSRLESFPFDSKFDGYDNLGYPIYDRAVGAHMLRTTFRQFFSDGIFGTPADAFKVVKDSGWNITVQPGIGVIRGAMGGIREDAVTIAIDSGTADGAYKYGVYLRYDENDDYRSLYICSRKSEAGASAAPDPVSDDAVQEYRLATIAVPSSATSLADATVTDERGMNVCPYAAPFEKIDLSGVLSDAREQAAAAYELFREYLDRNEGYINAAIGGDVAGYLQVEINELASVLTDDEACEYVFGE